MGMKLEVNIGDKSIALFWSKVEKTEDCWLWKGKRSRYGYGIGGCGPIREIEAHRVAYALEYGVLYCDPICILHSCDNPPCVNPAHLRPGTRLDNARDKEDRGRGNHAKGESIGASVLTEDIVLRARAMYFDENLSTNLIAKKLCIAVVTLRYALKGHTWKHVGGQTSSSLSEAGLLKVKKNRKYDDALCEELIFRWQNGELLKDIFPDYNFPHLTSAYDLIHRRLRELAGENARGQRVA